jgi:SAM-dependent methyltransferase
MTSNHQKPDTHHSIEKLHWEKVYARKPANAVSWYQAHPEISLAMIQTCGAGKEARVIDVGGGASTLVDHLLGAGYRYVTVLDIAGNAIFRARQRLGKKANNVTWLERDITSPLLDQTYDIWHDRAVFHFLTESEERERYLATLNEALVPGGHLIIATFALDGPTRCSGLEVQRYSLESLSRTLGSDYLLQETRSEAHQTPSGSIQHYIYCRYIR